MVFSLLTVSPDGGMETEQTKTFKFPMYDKKIIMMKIMKSVEKMVIPHYFVI